jgi:4-amino-4-deoxy-L-arabinose transferase-like glycosyltransferase
MLLFGYSLVAGRPLSGHESVLPQNAREMAVTHDWLIPTLGGHAWLERPPLPDWLIVAVDLVFGQTGNDRIVRIPAVLCAILVILLVGWIGSVLHGRTVGVLAGLILASMWEFYSFASDPESDIFLCLIVTGVLALFVRLEFSLPRSSTESTHFLGTRPWSVLGLFVLLGMTNLAKGLIFGTIMATVPLVGFLLWNTDIRAVRRYVWLWGWLACLIVSAAWPVLAFLQHPEIWDLWALHYVGRLCRGYIGEPGWYYLTAVPFVLLPWTLPALVGLARTGSRAWRERGSPERLLWAWGLLTPAVFSIPDGKHHHYLLHCMAPWAILGAVGAVRSWQFFQSGANWRRQPIWGTLAITLAGETALLLLGHRIPGPKSSLPVFLILLPVLAYAFCWLATRRDGRLATLGIFSLLAICYHGQYAYETMYVDDYGDDLAFMKQMHERLPAGEPVLIYFDYSAPLETCWLFFYSEDPSVLVEDWKELGERRIQQSEAYILARARERHHLESYGSVEVVLASKHTKGEHSPDDRRTLFHMRFSGPFARADDSTQK